MLIPRFALDDVHKTSLGPSEVPEATKTDDRGQKDGGQNAGPPKIDLAAQERPAETVDDADHGIARIKEAPVFRNFIAAETHRRHVKTELDDERNYVSKISVLYVERRKPESGTERSSERNCDKHWQSKKPPVR